MAGIRVSQGLRRFAYAAAALVILSAILVSAVRLSVHNIGSQRERIAAWVGQVVGRPVAIGEIEAAWSSLNPRLSVSELVVFDDAGNGIITFERAAIEIDLLASMRTNALVPERLVFSGIDIALERNTDGRISVAGLPPAESPMAEWLIQQRDFTVTDASIEFTDELLGRPPMRFTAVSSRIQNDDHGTRIRLRARPPESLAASLRLDLDARGNLLSKDWSGRITLNSESAKLREMLASAGLGSGFIPDGAASVTVATTWHDAKLREANMQVRNAALRWGDSEARYTDGSLGGRLSRHEYGWDLALFDINLDGVGERRLAIPWVVARWRERGTSDKSLVLAGAAADIGEIVSIVRGTNAVNRDLRKFLDDISPTGRLSEFYLGVVDGEGPVPGFALRTELEHVFTREAKNYPGIDDFNAQLELSSFSAKVVPRPGHEFRVHSATYLERSLEITALEGGVAWRRYADTEDPSWQLYTPDFSIEAAGIKLHARGSVSRSGTQTPFLNFVTDFGPGAAADLRLLIPRNVLHPKGDRWLRKLFRSGTLQRSQFVARGPAARFPYKHGDGVARATLHVTGAEAEYAEGWPYLTDVNATVVMNRERIESTMHKATILGAVIDGTTGVLPDTTIHEKVVIVSSRSRTNAENPKRLILESPLGDTKAGRIRDVNVSGEVDVTLDLNLSLYDEGDKELLGSVKFDGNTVHSISEQITLNDVHGVVSFTRDDWYGSDIDALFDGERVGLIVNGGLEDPNYDSEFRMTGQFGVQAMWRYVKRYVPTLYEWVDRSGQLGAIEGEFPWKLVLTIPETHAGKATSPRLFQIESSLAGMRSDLPWPLTKAPGERKPLVINTSFNENTGENRTVIDFGETLDMELLYRNDENGESLMRRAELIFGDSNPEFSTEEAIILRGETPRLPSTDWFKLFRSAGGTGSSLPARINLEVGHLQAVNRYLDNATLNGERAGDTATLAIESEQAVGRLVIAPDPATGEPHLDARFEKLWIDDNPETQERVDVDPRTLPPADFTCGSFRYGDMQFGTVTAETSRDGDGLVLDRLDSKHEHFDLQATGRWWLVDDVHQSAFDIDLQGGALETILANFGYGAASIEGGATEFDIQASWGGMPSDFLLERLTGEFRMRVTGGRLLDVEPGGGRLFGLLSLQSLPRRLTLDFDDLFQKGFAFDEITGTFQLDQGHAYTNSFVMNGPAARVEIAGRTGLTDQDYDQLVTVTPAISSSLPAAGAIFGPPGIGVGAVLFLGQKIFKSTPLEMDRILSREYSVTGSWEEPVIEKI